jgi:hypothetical protein
MRVISALDPLEHHELRFRLRFETAADSGGAGELAAHYSNCALGEIAVSPAGAATVFDLASG